MTNTNWPLAQDLHNLQYFHGGSLTETAGLVSDWAKLHDLDSDNPVAHVLHVHFNDDLEFGWTATVAYFGDKLESV